MSYTAVEITVVQNNQDRFVIDVDPWLVEITEGEDVVWDVVPDASVANVVARIENKQGQNNLPNGKPHPGGNGKRRGKFEVPASAQAYGKTEHYNIELDITDNSGNVHLITLDPDYRVRP